MEDKQRQMFSDLMTKELPEVINHNVVNISDDIDLSFEYIDMDTTNPLIDEHKTSYVPISVACTLRNKRTTESIVFNVNLLKMPVYQELGFMIRGNYMQMLDAYDKAAGLHTSRKQTQSSDTDKAVVQSENFRAVGFCRSKTKLYTVLSVRSGVSDAIEVSPVTFLRAITGMSKDELVAKFSYKNSFVVTLFDSPISNLPETKSGYVPETGADCIRAVYAAMFGKAAERNPDNGTISIKLAEIKKWLFKKEYFNKGNYAIQRIRYMQSFSYRAAGAVLAQDVNCNGLSITSGTVLTTQLLRELDATELTELMIEHDGVTYILHRFARYWFGSLNYTILESFPELGIEANSVLTLDDIDTLNNSEITRIRIKDLSGTERVLSRDVDELGLTQDDIFAVFDLWINNLNGLDSYDKEFDLTNRILVPFDKRVVQLVKDYMNSIVRRISAKYTVKGDAVSLNDYIEGYDKDINVDAFIDQIRSPELKLGQMAELCNIMSFTSKDYKSTIANLKNIDDNLITIQDHQFGRTDPFDIPESQKLASVQHRTMNSRLDETGSITVPYLRVHNGKIISEEPVYLTATEETDRYIAEWCETFVDEDGNKKDYVMARYNGEIVSVSTDNVSYREMSPYDGMSVSHACIPFPGHSDGKRITMGCNQLSQATPMAHKERPEISGGGESMVDYGFYAGDKVLQDFYKREVSICPELAKYKDRILSSNLKLLSKRAMHGSMKLTLDVLVMHDIYDEIQSDDTAGAAMFSDRRTTTELTVPYANQTTDNTLMTYEINPMPNNIYTPDDVVCCSNSCSTENKERCDCIDSGAQVLDAKMLSKGLALAKGLRIGYKTWSGSTIDDAMIISDECVYGDILTSIFTTRIVVTAKTFSDTEFEKFSAPANAPSYFEENGLPKVGTYLSAGDPVIAKVVHSHGTYKAKYKNLTMNQSGQVVYANFTTKNDEEAAEVVLAQRNVTEVGDKYAGRCGNKGVIAKIVPAEQMPFDPETGFRLQAILNPLGVPSRGNLSQFLDMDSTECLREDNKLGCVSPYNKNDLKWVLDLKEIHNVKPKIFIDGRTGQPFERPIHWGTLPMYKLHHMIKKKYHAIGMTSPVDPVYMQPRQGSKMDGGQSFGEMEAWCLMSINATHVLQEIYSYQSTNIGKRTEIQQSLEAGSNAPFEVEGNNSNNATMVVCYRSLGVDFKTNFDEQTFEFRPLTDAAIHALSATPVDSVENLHNASIFKGGSARYEVKDQARDIWSWIDLKVRLVHPNFIKNSNILHFIKVDGVAFNAKTADDIMRGRLMVEAVNAPVEKFFLYRTAKLSTDEYAGLPEESDATAELVTGLSAIAMMFDFSNTKALEQSMKGAVDQWLLKNDMRPDDPALSSEKGYLDRLKAYEEISLFNASESLSDYVISAFPVMPQIYRPKFAMSRQTDHVDFDWHYAKILSAVAAYDRNATTEAAYAIYDAICAFCGLKASYTIEEKKHKNIKTYFRGPDGDHGDHGKLRTNVQSKRVYCSGRTTIIPAHNTRMKPTEIGIPLTLATKMYGSLIIGKFSQCWMSQFPMKKQLVSELLLQCSKRNRTKFYKIWDKAFAGNTTMTDSTAYEEVTDLIYDCVEGRNGNVKQVVLSGRQPSLHKYAIRAYRPKIVLENAVNVHTLVCSGYNADFDGDQMWIQALIAEEAKAEALRLLSPSVDYINPKDSSLILKHTQDVVLGLYCMSMLKNNATSINVDIRDIHHYGMPQQLIADLDAGFVHTYDIACVTCNEKKYLGTIGRLYLNYVVGGFTDEPFTNPLQIPGIRTELYCEMKYDGIWRSGGNVKTGNFRYFKIADICMDCYNAKQETCIDTMQKLTELGFEYADKFCISLSLEDMMLQPVDKSEELTDPKLIELNAKSLNEICNEGLEKASDLRVQIEQDYFDGLISEEDKDDAIVSLFYSGTGDADSEYCTGIHSQVQKQLMDKLSLTQRNNNIFIMLDSGARGKADQIMRMCGFLPQLQKDKQSSLKTPVTHSFLQGLGSFDVHMTSYGIKQGLASTQNETPDAGYATHKGVYMTSGFKIVENDCGKTNWWYDVKYGDIDDSRSQFMPSLDWFNANLLGKTVVPGDKQTKEMFRMSDDDTQIKPEHFTVLIKNGGFHSIEVTDGIYEISIDSVVGKQLMKADKVNRCKLNHTMHNDCMTVKSVALLKKCHVRSVSTPDGGFTFKYKMDPCSKSLLLHRQCNDLPFTQTVLDSEMKEVSVTTKKTIEYIEAQNLTRVPVRILLDCKSEHGVCAHCYGLKFSSLTFPAVGDFVGTESAQAIGEPSAQLTISLINQGGVAGAAIDDGVKRFSSLLDGSVKNPALIAPRSGYVQIEQLGQLATVSIKPVNKDCDLCFGCSVNGDCPVSKDDLTQLPPCTFKKSVSAQLLTCADGDWVEASQPLTCQIPNPTDITTVTEDGSITDTDDFELVYRKKQVTWLQNYYETFSSKGIEINARHFEIFARVQNLQGKVFYSEDPNFKAGSSYEITSLQKASGKVMFSPKLSTRSEVIMDTSGAMAALSFERVQSIAASLCVKAYSSPYKYNSSLLGDVAVGTDLISGVPKDFTIAESTYVPEKKIKPTVLPHVSYKEIETQTLDDSSSAFDDFDFEAMLNGTEATDTTSPVQMEVPDIISEPAEPNAAVDTTSPVQMNFSVETHANQAEESKPEDSTAYELDDSLDEFDDYDVDADEGNDYEDFGEKRVSEEAKVSDTASPILMDF